MTRVLMTVMLFALSTASCTRRDQSHLCTNSKALYLLMNKAKLILADVPKNWGWYVLDSNRAVLKGLDTSFSVIRLDTASSSMNLFGESIAQLTVVIREMLVYGIVSANYDTERGYVSFEHSPWMLKDSDVKNLHVIQAKDYLAFKGRRDYDLLDTCNGIAIFSIARNRVVDP